jgi:hypothetical protein
MGDITRNQSFADGGNLTAAMLNNIIDSAAINTTLFTGKTEKTVPSNSDVLLVFDAGNSAFRKITRGNMIPASTSLGGFRNLEVKNDPDSPTDTVLISADEIMLRDLSDNMKFFGNAGLSVDLSLYSGAPTLNGRDFATITNSTWVHFWAISNGETLAGIISESLSAPFVPNGYIYKCYLGTVLLTQYSAFPLFVQHDKFCYKETDLEHPDIVVDAPSATGTWDLLSNQTHIPPNAVEISGYMGVKVNSGSPPTFNGVGIAASTAGIGAQFVMSEGVSTAYNEWAKVGSFKVPILTPQTFYTMRIGGDCDLLYSVTGWRLQ